MYNYDKNYFETIDSNEKAYWLGFITADGYVMDNAKKNNKSESVGLRIRLSVKDKSHLEKLNEALHYNKELKTVKNYGDYGGDLVEFSLYSRKIVNDLNDKGITSGNKSMNETVPDLKDENLIKNFILGYFDGDGCIVYTDKTHEWEIVSSLKMCIFVKEFLENKLDIKFQNIDNRLKKTPNLYRLRTGNIKNIIKIYEYLYSKNASIYHLDRKYELINKLYLDYLT